MTGCRYGAKNTLLKNYLGLAESAGAQVHPMTTVTGFEQRSDGLWEVNTARTGGWLRRKRRTFTATHLVLAAGTCGTQKLLFKMRDGGKLPKLSDKLGVLTRTNSESIVGAGRLEVRDDLDLTHGVAITSSIHPTSDTHIEPVRYGKGSNAMGLLQTLMTDGAGPEGTDVPRWRQLLDQAREDPKKMLRMLNPRQWSERTMIALVMQHLDNSITTYTKRGKLGIRRMVSKQGHGEPNPTWIPVGNEVTRRHRREDRRRRGRHLGRAVQHPADRALPRRRGDRRQSRARRDRPVSAGVRLSDDVGDGRCGDLGQPRSQPVAVASPRRPSGRRRCGRTRASEDLRPQQGEAYQRLAPIAPEQPVVPADAPGALRRLPLEPSERSAQRVNTPLDMGTPYQRPARDRSGPGAERYGAMRTAYHQQLSALSARSSSEMCGLAADAMEHATVGLAARPT